MSPDIASIFVPISIRYLMMTTDIRLDIKLLQFLIEDTGVWICSIGLCPSTCLSSSVNSMWLIAKRNELIMHDFNFFTQISAAISLASQHAHTGSSA